MDPQWKIANLNLNSSIGCFGGYHCCGWYLVPVEKARIVALMVARSLKILSSINVQNILSFKSISIYSTEASSKSLIDICCSCIAMVERDIWVDWVID